MSFNTQPPEGGWFQLLHQGTHITVSTHSRPKAAGRNSTAWRLAKSKFQHTAARRRLVPESKQRNAKTGGFNTQPPEGGWLCANCVDV